MKKYIVTDLLKSLLFYLEYQKTRYLQSYFAQKHTRNKSHIFYQNHKLTPLKKFECLDL